MNIRILLADDHALVRAGLRALIKEMPGMEMLGTFAAQWSRIAGISQ